MFAIIPIPRVIQTNSNCIEKANLWALMSKAVVWSPNQFAHDDNLPLKGSLLKSNCNSIFVMLENLECNERAVNKVMTGHLPLLLVQGTFPTGKLVQSVQCQLFH